MIKNTKVAPAVVVKNYMHVRLHVHLFCGLYYYICTFVINRVRVKQRTYFLLVSATEMAIWQAILTQPNLPFPSPSLSCFPLT
jgi:hypothetical protein